MSDAAIRRFVAVMVTSYIVIAMIGAIGAWLFLAVPKSAQLNDARQQIDKLEDQLDVSWRTSWMCWRKATACWPKRSRSRKS